MSPHLTAVLFAFTLLGQLPPPAAATEFQTAPVIRDSTSSMTTVGGTVVPFKEVTLAAQTPGLVRHVAGREGDQVSEGQNLVAIDDTELQARRRSAVAQMMAADAALRNARVQYDRELISPNSGRPTGMGLPSMMDQFMSPFSGQYAGANNPWMRRYADLHTQAQSLDDARARILQSQAAIEELDARIRDATLTAPFDGVITKKLVEQGDTVQPGQPLLQVAHVTFLRIQAEVPVRLVAALQRGMMLPARLDVGNGVDVQARVSQIFPVADANQHTVTVKLDLPRGIPGGPGMYAEVRIPDTTSPVASLATVPQESLFYRGSLPAVMILKDGRPSLRLVRVGRPVGGNRVTILSGLDGDEHVILPGPDGQALIRASEQAAAALQAR
ncbi:MAG: efflux RND transporter periplasmic adaptor subunit [Hyphomicrobiaceae bacterium]|nr:efflux RND transporter periplasmic adaptor subunit [Hyphomicrobiaceae bacterium]